MHTAHRDSISARWTAWERAPELVVNEQPVALLVDDRERGVSPFAQRFTLARVRGWLEAYRDPGLAGEAEVA